MKPMAFIKAFEGKILVSENKIKLNWWFLFDYQSDLCGHFPSASELNYYEI